MYRINVRKFRLRDVNANVAKFLLNFQRANRVNKTGEITQLKTSLKRILFS